ncbi:MAG: hypothetical protein FK731_13455, partial [Asgard group archaeon]|nr:hypothetical protein [Asgard group archaeon]
KNLSFNNFKKIIDKLPSDVIIDFTGFSEPFLNIHTYSMMHYSIKNSRQLIVNTTLLGTGYEPTIFDNYMKEVCIHVPDQKFFKVKDELSWIGRYKRFRNIRQANKLIALSRPSNMIIDIIGDDYIIIKHLSRAGNLFERSKNENKFECKNSFLHNVMLPNGDVVVCCMDYSLKHKLGNLIYDDYESLHNSETIKLLKEAKNNSNIDCICRYCENIK